MLSSIILSVTVAALSSNTCSDSQDQLGRHSKDLNFSMFVDEKKIYMNVPAGS